MFHLLPGSALSDCWRQRARQQEGLLRRLPGGQGRPQHRLRLVHQQRFLPPDAVCTEAAAPQLHQQPAALALHRALLRPALWGAGPSEEPRASPARELPVRDRVVLPSFHTAAGGERPSRKKARGRSRQRSGVRHLRGGGPAASGPGRAPGPGLGRAEWVGQGRVRGQAVHRRWRHQPQPPQPEGPAWVEAVGEPGVGKRRSALPERGGGRPQRAVPQTLHSAMQHDQSDVAADETGERSRDSGGCGALCDICISKISDCYTYCSLLLATAQFFYFYKVVRGRWWDVCCFLCSGNGCFHVSKTGDSFLCNSSLISAHLMIYCLITIGDCRDSLLRYISVVPSEHVHRHWCSSV